MELNRDNLIFLDTEVFKNYFLFCALWGDKFLEIEVVSGSLSETDKDKIRKVLRKTTTISFNGKGYDIPIISAALKGYTTAELWELSNELITSGKVYWKITKARGIITPNIKHIDIMRPASNTRLSLKKIGALLDYNDLRNLPYDPEKPLPNKKAVQEVKKYCRTDVEVTCFAFESIKENLEMRQGLEPVIGRDIMSHSDAAIAETYFKSKCYEHLGHEPKPVKYPNIYNYKAFKDIKFNSKTLNSMLAELQEVDFHMDKLGRYRMGVDVMKMTAEIGEGKYKLGHGGIHSTGKKDCYKSDDEYVILDFDVTSYYPALILKYHISPPAMREFFLKEFEKLVSMRLSAKSKGHASAKGLKIIINGTFGKMGSDYSVLYSPDNMLNVTISGQLLMLMLVEMMEDEGFKVISANTDGVTVYVKRIYIDKVNAVARKWEKRSGLNLEDVEYSELYSRSVNHYFAVKTNGEVKGKGRYVGVDSGDELANRLKRPVAPVIMDALAAFLIHDVPIPTTIRNERDPMRFCFIQQVRGGAIYKGQNIGNVARWAWVEGGDTLTYSGNGNKVPMADMSVPVLTRQFGEKLIDKGKLDMRRYIDQTLTEIEDLGALYQL